MVSLVRKKRAIIVLASLVLLSAAAGQVRAADVLRLVGTIPLPDVTGRIDHMAVDGDGGRLFVAALSNDSLEVIDLRRGARIRSISGLREPQGVFYDAEHRRIFVSNSRDGTLRVYDTETLVQTGSISFSGDADNVRHDARAKRLYVGYGNGGLGIIDTRTLARIGEIRFSGHPEAFELEERTSKIYANIPTQDRVAVIDRTTQKVVDLWRLSCAGNFPMALDEAGHRLFIGCRTPAEVLVYDTATGKQMAALPIAPDVDDLFYDPAGKYLFASCGAGSLLAFAQRAPDRYELLTEMKTSPGARTSLFDAVRLRLYVAAPRDGSRPAQVMVYEVVR